MSNKNTQTKNVSTAADRAKKRLLRSSAKDGNTLLIQYENTLDGYDEDYVEEKRDEYGENKITKRDEESMLKRFVAAFINPFTIVLMVLAAVSLVTDVILTPPGEADYTAVIIIMSMVIISGLLRFIQELRSNSAAKNLTEMVRTTVCAARQYFNKETDETHYGKKKKSLWTKLS